MAASSPATVYAQTHFLIVTDAGQDCDDELALIMLFGLIKNGDAAAKATIIANLHPAADRARLVAGLVNTVAMRNKKSLPDIQKSVMVAVGTHGNDTAGKHHNKFLESGKAFVSPIPVELSGDEAFLRTYKAAEKAKAVSSISILCISSMTDVAKFASENTDLFAKYTKEVTIMGGAVIETVGGDAAAATPATGGSGAAPAGSGRKLAAGSTAEPPTKRLVPDKDAHNLLFDWDASVKFFQICQDRKVPMVIFSRHASGAVQFPPALYDSLANTGCPIAMRLRDTQKYDLDLLWKRSIGTTPETRQGLPERCNRAWYLKTFCGGEDTKVEDDAIWRSVVKLTISDLNAIVAAVPKYRDKFFDPVKVPVNGAVHQIIGLSADQKCVADANGYLEFATKILLTICGGDAYAITPAEDVEDKQRPFSVRTYLSVHDQKIGRTSTATSV